MTVAPASTERPTGWLLIVTGNGEDGHYYIVAGHRRTEAGRLAGMAKLPAIVRAKDATARSEAHLIEIDLLRGGTRPPIALQVPEGIDYLAYVAQAIPTGWHHLLYPWKLREPFPCLPIPKAKAPFVTESLSM